MHSRLTAVLLFGVFSSQVSYGYSILTHEAVLDSAWKDNLQPLLLKRFPNATEEELRMAHAYAYGGAIIQDIGYYPFGNKFVSDLTHYVRSGDFILNLIAEAQDLNEYAFGLGSLAHYASDNLGHRVAVNRAVPMLYPKLRRQFGDVITYADHPASHIKTEFAFDVAQVAEGNYASDAYHQFIGFEVAQAAFERAFLKTYALELKSVIQNESLAIGTYRFAVSTLIPSMTKAAWSMKGKELMKSRPGLTKRKFLYNLSRKEYEKKWDAHYQKPGFGARVIAFFFRVLPKVGPLKAFAFHPPTPEAEKLFMQSVNQTLDQYRRLLSDQANGSLKLADENFDTGEPVRPGKYRLADQAYATLLDKLQGKAVPPELRADILAYFSDLNAPYAMKRDPKSWNKVLKDLDALKAEKPSPAN